MATTRMRLTVRRIKIPTRAGAGLVVDDPSVPDRGAKQEGIRSSLIPSPSGWAYLVVPVPLSSSGAVTSAWFEKPAETRVAGAGSGVAKK